MRKLVLISLRALAYWLWLIAQWIMQPLLGQVTAKPPLCRWVIPGCATKFYINITVQAKVVFTGNSTADIRLKLTARESTVRVKKLTVLTLKKR